MVKIFQKTIVIGIVIFFYEISCSSAQVAINAAGDGGTGTGGSIEYSVGQVNYITNSGSGGTISEGVQHSYEIFVITSLPDAPDIGLYCSVYPNPTQGKLILKIEYTENNLYSCQLYDITGKLLGVEWLTTNEAVVEMENLPAGIYLLKVKENQKDIKTFRIIKY